jgi:hypothetical protein
MPAEVSVTNTVSYKGIFDQSIYDQTSYLAETPERLVTDKGLIDFLKQKKLERLEKVVLENIKVRIEQYEAVTKEGLGFLPPAFQAAFSAVPRLDVFDRTFATMSKDDAKKEIFNLAFQHKLMIKGIDKESVCDLEIKYILIKRKIASKAIQDEIEKALLLCREEAVFLELLRKFIDNALAMPISTLVINYRTALEKLRSSPGFNNFETQVQRTLSKIVTKLAFDSLEPDDAPGNHRCIYYFHGDHGAGKSMSARLIPTVCNLPYLVVSLRTIADLSSDALEGTERTMMTNNPGLLANALMSKNKDGKSYENAVLILEDFDRVFLDGKDSQALVFLLDYLDPTKRDFLSRYFSSLVKISRLSIIITANRAIPKKPEDGFDHFAALRSRVSELFFANFPRSTIDMMLMPIANHLLKKYGIKHKTAETAIADAIVRQQEKTSGATPEPRDLQRQLEEVIIDYQMDMPAEEVPPPVTAPPPAPKPVAVLPPAPKPAAAPPTQPAPKTLPRALRFNSSKFVTISTSKGMPSSSPARYARPPATYSSELNATLPPQAYPPVRYAPPPATYSSELNATSPPQEYPPVRYAPPPATYSSELNATLPPQEYPPVRYAPPPTPERPPLLYAMPPLPPAYPPEPAHAFPPAYESGSESAFESRAMPPAYPSAAINVPPDYLTGYDVLSSEAELSGHEYSSEYPPSSSEAASTLKSVSPPRQRYGG